MPTPAEAVVKSLMRLRAVHEPNSRLGQEQIRLQTAAYVEALQDIAQRWFEAAVDWWVRHGKHFPKPAELRETAAELEEDAGAAESLKLRRLVDGTDPGSQMRNEVIQILGDFDLELRRHYGGGQSVAGSKSEGYRLMLGELAAHWQRLRPPGGLEELTQSRQGPKLRLKLEAWARHKLGLPPLAPGYDALLNEPADAVLERWRANDTLYAQKIAEGAVPSEIRLALDRVHRSLVARRWTEQPELAARYYQAEPPPSPPLAP